MSAWVIETEHVVKMYGSVRAVNDVTMHIEKGEIYGLIGDNGAGKTSLLKLLVGHIYPTSGKIALFQHSNEAELGKCRRKIGALIEQPGFFPDLTVEQNLEYYRIQKAVPDKKKTEEILKITGIWQKRDRKGRALSMGMKQRLGLAIALMGDPEVLILDEPINGLDPTGMLEFRELFQRLNKERGMTILLSSHILSELQQMASKFGFIREGKLIREMTREQLQAETDQSLQDYYVKMEKGVGANG